MFKMNVVIYFESTVNLFLHNNNHTWIPNVMFNYFSHNNNYLLWFHDTFFWIFPWACIATTSWTMNWSSNCRKFLCSFVHTYVCHLAKGFNSLVQVTSQAEFHIGLHLAFVWLWNSKMPLANALGPRPPAPAKK